MLAVAARCADIVGAITVAHVIILAAFIVFAGLTINDCTKSIQDYLDEPMITQVSVQQQGDEERKPNFTLCLDVSFNPLSENETINVSSLIGLSSSHLQRLLTWHKVGAHVQLSPLLIATAKLLVDLSRIENSLHDVAASDLAGIVQADFDVLRFEQNVLRPEVQAVYELWRDANTNLFDLIRQVGAKICSAAGIQVSYQLRKHSIALPVCTPANTSWFGVILPASSADAPSTMCLKVKDIPALRRAIDEVVVKHEALRVFDAGYVLIDFAMRSVQSDAFGDSLYLDYAKDYVISYDIRGHVIRKGTKRKACFQSADGRDSLFECLALSCASRIREACGGCLPLSWFSYYDSEATKNGTPCVEKSIAINSVVANLTNATQYVEWMLKPENRCEKEIRYCLLLSSDHCVTPCRAWYYGVTKSELDEEKQGFVRTIRIQMPLPSYPIFEDELQFNLYQLVSNVGGIVGLWLGASFFGVVYDVVKYTRRFLRPASAVAPIASSTKTFRHAEEQACENCATRIELESKIDTIIDRQYSLSPRVDRLEAFSTEHAAGWGMQLEEARL